MYTARPEIDAVMHEEALEQEAERVEQYRNQVEGSFVDALYYDGIDKPPPFLGKHYPTLRAAITEMLCKDAILDPLMKLLEQTARSTDTATRSTLQEFAAVYAEHFDSLLPAQPPPPERPF